MAENKRSFILYADLIHTVRKLPKGKQAELFMAILEYVNDENPVVKDLIVGVAFEPVKQQLKRDLKRWDSFREKQAEYGRMGGRPKKQSPESEENRKGSLNSERVESLNVNATVNVTDTVTANDSLLKKNDEKNLLSSLTEIEAGKTIEFTSITLRRNYDRSAIEGLWTAFGISNEEKYYQNRSEKIKHFRNWIKTQPYDTDKKFNGGGNKGNSGKPGTSEARTDRARNW